MKLRLKSLALSLLLAAAAAPAWALGLGQIQVKSRINEPLLADIPVVSSDPAELAELQARLASPETFVRIGLPLPDRLVSDLHFNVVDGDDGRVYIRVTSTAPVTQPLVNFLVEVDWGQGKLVREYSALVATPNAMVAAAQPVIQAPTVAAPANTIDRSTAPVSAAPVVAAPAPTVATIPPPAKPAEAIPPAPAPTFPTTTQPIPAAPAPVVATAPAPTPAATAPAAISRAAPQASDQTYGPLRRGETLGAITNAMQAAGQSPDEVMQSLVALNPDAFIGGDPNRVLAGAVLRMPEGTVPPPPVSPAAAKSVAKASAAATRSSRTTSRRPVDVANATTAPNISRPAPDAAAAAPTEPKRSAEARLRIMPGATPDPAAAGSKSGRGTKGGDGDMLQQLQTSQETIATREAEIKELKSRVTELEQLQQKQAQLIAMKNSELASAQQKLAARQQSQPAAPTGIMGGNWWLPAALGSVLVLGLGLLWRRRRAVAADADVDPKPNQKRKGFGMRGAGPVAQPAPGPVVKPVEPAFAAFEPVPVPTPAPVEPPAAANVRDDGLPTWVRGDAWLPQEPAVQPAAAAPVDLAPEPAPLPPPAVTPPPAPVAAEPLGPLNSHVQLAQTYIDLGDSETARTILQGVLDNGDATARAQASAVLRSLH